MPERDKYFFNRLVEFQNCFDDAEISSHEGRRAGGPLEIFFLEFLSEFLPLKYGAAAGKVLGKDGKMSPYSGAIIYDSVNCPVIREEENELEYRIVPAESVIAVIEVAPVLTAEAFSESVDIIKLFGEIDGMKNDAFGAFFAYSPPEFAREEDIIAYLNRINNDIIESGIFTFLRFGCVLPNRGHAAVESATGSVPCYEYLKSRLLHDETVPHKSVKDFERYGNFSLAYPETVFHVFMINLVENLNKWTYRKYNVMNYFSDL